MLISETFRLLLDSIGRSEEYQYYLQRFQSQEAPPFAYLVPDREAALQFPMAIQFSLRFLTKLELHPVILLTGPHREEMARALLRQEEMIYLKLSPSEDSVRRELAELANTLKNGTLSAIIQDNHRNLFHSLEMLSGIWSTRRFHFIRSSGAIHDRRGKILNYVDRSTGPDVGPEDRAIFTLMGQLFEKKAHLHLSVTSPVNLLKEIFTIKGAGSVYRKRSLIRVRETMDEIDPAALVDLLRESFQRELKSTDFFRNVARIYLEDEYRGAALMEETEYGVYLSKFAVNIHARGEGIAQEIWDAIIADSRNKKLFWRSREENSIQRWYQRISDGSHSVDGWKIFWRGVEIDQIPAIIEYCRQRPQDFMNP